MLSAASQSLACSHASAWPRAGLCRPRSNTHLYGVCIPLSCKLQPLWCNSNAKTFTARRACIARTMRWQMSVCPSVPVCPSVWHTPVFCLNGYTQRYSYDLSRKRRVLRCLYEFSFFGLLCFLSFWYRLLLWTPAQRKRASMLYFANVFFKFFLWPPYSPALVNGGSRKFYTWWTLSGIKEATTWIFPGHP